MAEQRLPRVFLTGGSGFIGSHVLDYLFKSRKYVVTAALRSPSRIDDVLELHPEYRSSPAVNFIVVPDLCVAGACDFVLAGDEFDYIIHTAGVFRFDGDINKSIVEPSLHATKSLINSAKKQCTKTLKTFVYTSSAAVLILGQSDPSTFKEQITEEDVGNLPMEAALASKDPFACYIASKLEAESYLRSITSQPSALWKPVVLYPVGVCGPIIHPIKHFANATHSMDWGYGFLSGEWKTVPPVPMFNIVDVRDLGKLHVLALENEKVKGQRINCSNSKSMYSHQLMADVIRTLWPQWDGPLGTPGTMIPEGMSYFEISNQRIKDLFGEGVEYINAEVSVVDYLKSVKSWMEKLGSPLSKGIGAQ